LKKTDAKKKNEKPNKKINRSKFEEKRNNKKKTFFPLVNFFQVEI